MSDGSAPSTATRTLKKGEHLFQVGDPCENAFLIQSGVVQLYVPRGKQRTDLYQVRAPQALGLECLLGIPSYGVSALVLSDLKAILIPASQASAAFTSGSQLLRLFLKTGFEKEKLFLQDLKSLKAGSDTSPCPTEGISKLFGAIFHSARYKGETREGVTTVSWEAFRVYAQRIFSEPPIRIENACNILVRLGIASYGMQPDETDPEAPPKIGTVSFSDLAFVEAFFEYYAHHYFKGSSPALLKPDERCSKYLKALLASTQGAKVDRSGVVQAQLTGTLEKLNAIMGTQSTDYLALLESKGLFAKKTPSNAGGLLQFHRSEFESALRFWGVLKEIELWNELGSVSLETDADPATATTGEGTCPGCSKPLDATSTNFCGNCGHRLNAAKADAA